MVSIGFYLGYLKRAGICRILGTMRLRGFVESKALSTGFGPFFGPGGTWMLRGLASGLSNGPYGASYGFLWGLIGDTMWTY